MSFNAEFAGNGLRRALLGVWALSALLLAAGDGPAAAPNVVLIMADDLGYGDLGCYGAQEYRTPSCDRLAQQGMRFLDAHSPSAVCSPTRYGLLTGRYAWRTWLKNWVLFENMPLLIESQRLTVPSLLRHQGYACGCVGKWHLGWGGGEKWDFRDGLRPGPLEVGFDSFFGVPHSHNSSERHQVYVRDRRIVGLGEGTLDDKSVRRRVVRRLEDTATTLSVAAVEFIEQHTDERFFLYYPTTNIHFPLTPHERFQGRGQAGVYGEFVLEFDWAVGEVLDALDRLDLSDQTLVIVTSDNGARPHSDMHSHRPNGSLRGTKRTIYEGGHRVPMIVRWPDHIEAGSTSEETVCLSDWLATLAAIVEYPLPTSAGEDSFDITPVLFGQDYQGPIREATVHHSVSGQFAIRKGKWKLIEGGTDGDYAKPTGLAQKKARGEPTIDPTSGQFRPLIYDILPDPEALALVPPYQLYDLAADPSESENIWMDHPKIVEDLVTLLDRYRSTGRSTPTDH